ncbi:MAG: hypothetical protein Q9162_000992 [Coniocarpon cinnabarinum]
MAAPSPPIDIKPASRSTSASPQNQPSNFASAFQQAGVDGMDISYQGRDALNTNRHDSLGVPDGSMGASRTAARPIGGAGARRASSIGSFAGGMSFGGISMNSWMQDECVTSHGDDRIDWTFADSAHSIMMAGTSPFATNHMQSPSFHSSSYLPKKEADFWSNLRCCDIDFKDLHELLQHFEEVHRDGATSFPHRLSTPGKGGFYRRKSSAFNQSRAFNASAHGVQPLTNQPSQVQDGVRGNSADMETIGEMEMDFEDGGNPYNNQNNNTMDNSRIRPGPINPRLANAQQLSTPHSSTPSTPATARPNSTNPMVSQGNTPSFTTATTAPTSGINSPLPVSTSGLNDENGMLTSLDQDFSNMDFNNINPFNNTTNNDFLELTINDPARALFSENGGINAAHAQLFGFVNGANTNPDNHGGAMQPTPMRPNTGVAPHEAPPVDPYGGEDRPFKCLVVGCEKAYKNANGLRYHERHGHSTQTLTKNADGTLSIVNPETGEAFPGTVGMEKEKPYRCEACGKRYKNLNGLKYHKNHSPPCNPDLDVSKVGLPEMGRGGVIDGDGPMEDGIGLGGAGGASQGGMVGVGGGWQL